MKNNVLSSLSNLQQAIFDYHNTRKTVSEILKEYGISKSYFYRHLDFKESFRQKETKARKYFFELEKFKKNSADKYYWLGFISADGCVIKNSLVIELKASDEKHLRKFNSFCQNTSPIRKRINNLGVSCASASINSWELIEYLKSFNIYPRKSLSFSIPLGKIPSCFLMDYVRGLIDGDGSLWITKKGQISLGFCSGSEECVIQVKNLLGLQEQKITKEKKSNTYHLQVTGNKKAKKILDRIYSGSAVENRLDRKYNIYQTLNQEID